MLENLAYVGFLVGLAILALGNFGRRPQNTPGIGTELFVWTSELGGWLCVTAGFRRFIVPALVEAPNEPTVRMAGSET